MNIPKILAELKAERDRLTQAIDALSALDREPAPAPDIGKPHKPRKYVACKYKCGREFSREPNRLQHELDCARVVRPGASDPVTRKAV